MTFTILYQIARTLLHVHSLQTQTYFWQSLVPSCLFLPKNQGNFSGRGEEGCSRCSNIRVREREEYKEEERERDIEEGTFPHQSHPLAVFPANISFRCPHCNKLRQRGRKAKKRYLISTCNQIKGVTHTGDDNDNNAYFLCLFPRLHSQQADQAAQENKVEEEEKELGVYKTTMKIA